MHFDMFVAVSFYDFLFLDVMMIVTADVTRASFFVAVPYAQSGLHLIVLEILGWTKMKSLPRHHTQVLMRRGVDQSTPSNSF